MTLSVILMTKSEESVKDGNRKQILGSFITSLALNVSAGCRYQRLCLILNYSGSRFPRFRSVLCTCRFIGKLLLTGLLGFASTSPSRKSAFIAKPSHSARSFLSMTVCVIKALLLRGTKYLKQIFRSKPSI